MDKRLKFLGLLAIFAAFAAVVIVPLTRSASDDSDAALKSMQPTKVTEGTNDESGPLRDAEAADAGLRAEDRYEAEVAAGNIPSDGEEGSGSVEGQEFPHNLYPNRTADQGPDLGLQTTAPGTQVPAPLVSFDAISNTIPENGTDLVRPPDTNADVGPNHIVETVNLSIAVYDKNGVVAPGFPKRTNALWAGFTRGPVCRDNNDGDPIVLYDQLANRWLVSQFALPNFPNGPFYQCIAVSTTGDPTGTYNRYQFQYPVNRLNDYPKFGVWPDAYYASFNEFTPPTFSFHGAGAIAYERTKMLNGQKARMVYFDVSTIDPNTGGQLPSDLNGSTRPRRGTPNFFVDMEYDDFGYPSDRLQLWKFKVDWVTPANSTFTGPTVLTPNPFGTALCGFFNDCIPQPGTTQKLDSLSDRLMNRLNYRRIGTTETLVVSHSINVGGNRAGLRWYELRNPNGAPTIHQQGTFAPADGLSRWMGSINMDKQGNIMAGYSVGNATTAPGIRYAGRLAADPLGDLTQGEGTIMNGVGSQTSPEGRWGDYSTMSVDPVDDCTFWYAQQYMPATSFAGWTTHIASMKFPGCV
jgi:hypothetical protein